MKRVSQLGNCSEFMQKRATIKKVWHEREILIRADCMSFEFVEIAVVMQFSYTAAVPGNVFVSFSHSFTSHV